MRPLAFVDLETTGSTASTDRITEIGIVEVDADGTVREWQQLVNPGIEIPPFIVIRWWLQRRRLPWLPQKH